MRTAVTLSLLVLALAACLPAAELLAGGEPDVAIGVLEYAPKPEISICFCGSFRIVTGAERKDCYLTSDAIDLSQFIGARIMVSGKGYSAICEGTLSRSCSYMSVEKVVPLTSAGVVSVDWGLVKMIYR